MAPRKRRDVEAPPPADPLQKIASLLAIMVTKEMETEQAAKLLERIRFTDPEINSVLGISDSYLRVMRFKSRKAKKARK